MPQNWHKALEFWQRAGELGSTGSYYNIGKAYEIGRGVEVDKKKAKHHYELAAMGGDSMARNNLGCLEAKAGNIDRAMKHWMIAAGVIEEYTKTVHRWPCNKRRLHKSYTIISSISRRGEE